MPLHIKLIGRYANTVAGLLFLLVGIVGIGEGNFGIFLLGAGLTALALFNLYVVEKTARLLSEEAWLESEVHKAELRKKLAEMGAGPSGESRPAHD